MNISHSEMTDWGLSHITIGKKDTILDVGCGGGGTIRKLAGIATEGKVYGIDYSEQSVRISRRTNRRLEESGHVEIRQGSVSSLPYPDAMFDLVTAVESHYFWPDLVSDMKELFRVLKPGGMLVMMGGEYKGGRYDERNEQWVELARLARAVTRARNFPNLAATKKLG
jgi:ubiquinone/menaquinone biosynthesis C-methylase UbiE